MAIPVSQDLDFGSGFQPISALMDNRASDPGSPKPGPFGIRAGLMLYYDGSQVVTVGGGGAATPGVTDELPIQSVQRFKDGVPTPGGYGRHPGHPSGPPRGVRLPGLCGGHRPGWHRSVQNRAGDHHPVRA